MSGGETSILIYDQDIYRCSIILVHLIVFSRQSLYIMLELVSRNQQEWMTAALQQS